ncbi:hypothetical protein [Kribbella voronezhensis]|nr:hypothetical protein [Kribbella voronezhensis]
MEAAGRTNLHRCLLCCDGPRYPWGAHSHESAQLVHFAAKAPWGTYRDVGLWLVEPNPLAFGILMLAFETVTAALIVSRGRYVKWGLLGAIVFLVGITPLGLEEVPNVILAAGLTFLLTKSFPTDAWTIVRRHRRRKLGSRTRTSTSSHASDMVQR